MEIGSRVWAVLVVRKENKKNGTRPVHFPTTWGAAANTIPTQLGKVVNPLNVITLAKFEAKRFIIVTLVSG